MGPDVDPDTPRLTHLRRRRAELRDSMVALEHSLAAPAAAGPADWAERVRAALRDLSADLRVHLTLTEGPDGLYRELERHAPRVAGPVERLLLEHHTIVQQLQELERAVDAAADARTPDDAELVRRLGTALLGNLMRHRQRDADVVYEAYEFDVGGET